MHNNIVDPLFSLWVFILFQNNWITFNFNGYRTLYLAQQNARFIGKKTDVYNYMGAPEEQTSKTAS